MGFPSVGVRNWVHLGGYWLTLEIKAWLVAVDLKQKTQNTRLCNCNTALVTKETRECLYVDLI